MLCFKMLILNDIIEKVLICIHKKMGTFDKTKFLFHVDILESKVVTEEMLDIS